MFSIGGGMGRRSVFGVRIVVGVVSGVEGLCVKVRWWVKMGMYLK